MATIYPFKALRPDSFYTDQLVFANGDKIVVMGGGKTENSLPSLKSTLESSARERPETTAGQQAAYAIIENSVHDLLQSGHLRQEQEAGMYVYEASQNGQVYTGIWALTDLQDNIKIHELTFADSVRRMKNYREHTGLEGSPILLTYSPDRTINSIIAKVKTTANKTTCGDRESVHHLWKITGPDTLQQLTQAFAALTTIYLADGHHRLGSARKLAMEQSAFDKAVFGSVSSLYIAADQLGIKEYNRVFLPEVPVSKSRLLKELTRNFHLMESTGNRRVCPVELHRMGMLHEGEWYHLRPKQTIKEVDTAILQEQLLAPIFKVENPETDTRLKCFGGPNGMEEIQGFILENPTAIAFTLCPVSVGQLMTIADAGDILPPKATWIEPKVPFGLLIHKH